MTNHWKAKRVEDENNLSGSSGWVQGLVSMDNVGRFTQIEYISHSVLTDGKPSVMYADIQSDTLCEAAPYICPRWNKQMWENDIYQIEFDPFATIVGVIKHGEFECDFTEGEYPPQKVYGWYLEVLRISKLSYVDDENVWLPASYQYISLAKLIEEKRPFLYIGNIIDNPELAKREEIQFI